MSLQVLSSGSNHLLAHLVCCALRPEVMKHDRSNDDAEHDSDDPVPNYVEFCIWRKSLKDAHEKGEGNLQTSIRNSFTAGVMSLSIYLVATCSHLETDISQVRFYC